MRVSCRTGPLRAGRSLRDLCWASRGARVAREGSLCRPTGGATRSGYTHEEVVAARVGRAWVEVWCDKIGCPLRLIAVAWDGGIHGGVVAFAPSIKAMRGTNCNHYWSWAGGAYGWVGTASADGYQADIA
jgi:hypothetical protein